MVMNKRDLDKAFSPTKVKRLGKRKSGGPYVKPSTSGSTSRGLNGDKETQTSIKVIVRVRPHNEREDQDNLRTVVKVIDSKMLIFDPKEEENPFFYRGVVQKGRDLLKKQNKELQFMFDGVFDTHCSNTEVFEGTTKDIISDLLDGYNCSVFAYGATGAGKTHTMLGKEHDPGITFRTVAELFSQIDAQSELRDFNFGVTYLEIYNENVQDLLHKSGPLALREDSRAGVVVAGLKIVTIQSADELLTLLAQGNRNRTQHPTDANAESSRSHAVFQVYVNITNKLDGQVKQVKLSMIDLAGSERASATGSKGARFKEGANINKSLLALGNCINNLAEGIKHIPYRDSKLTRLLKDSLGGNCRTVMIANVGPSSLSYEDTYNTLRYANRAKKIKTHTKKNIISCEMHVTGYIKLVTELKKEINLLKQQLQTGETRTIQKPAVPSESEESKKELKDLRERLVALLDRKQTLNDKILSLQSSDKILYCRIQYKIAADNRLKSLTSAVDLVTEQQNVSGKSRVNKSLQYFKRQRDVVKHQMRELWTELQRLEQDLITLNVEIKTKGLTDKVSDAWTTHKFVLDHLRVQCQFDHAKKISSIKECEIESLETIIRTMSGTLQSYYSMMRGYGTITDKMNEQFKQMVKSLEGVRNIKWADGFIGTQDSYSLTCLSLNELLDPLNSKIPIYTPSNCLSEEDTIIAPIAPSLDNNSFDSSPQSDLDEKSHQNSSVNTDENKELVPKSAEQIDVTQLNSTFNLMENNTKKRAHSDKSPVFGKTVVKQAKKISPKLRTANVSEGINGKENKTAQRPATMMSAKSVAILNKLKMDRPKLVPQAPTINGDNSGSNNLESTLKVMRPKERRGMQASHPYQKNSNKNKLVTLTSTASSRFPASSRSDS